MSGRAPRVEFVVPSLDVGGMETMLLGMARGLIARGRRVGVTCLEHEGALADAARADGVAVSVVPTPGLRPFVSAPPLRAHFERLRPDVVHAHNGVWEKASRAARQARVRSVGHTLHGFNNGERWFAPHLRRWAMRHSDWVVAVSEPVRAYLAREVRVPPARLHVIVNGIDTARFRPGPRDGALRARLGVPDAAPLVGIVARLDPVKNHGLLLDAFARALPALPPDARLVLVGDGPTRGAVEARVAELGLGGRVHLAGTCADAPAVYRELDVLVLSSTAEGTPMSVLEAMASGLPVVATAVGGVPALLGDDAGVLVPSGGRDALADALRALLDDPTARQRLGTRARARVQARFSADAMLDQYEAVYGWRRGASVAAPPTEPLCAA